MNLFISTTLDKLGLALTSWPAQQIFLMRNSVQLTDNEPNRSGAMILEFTSNLGLSEWIELRPQVRSNRLLLKCDASENLCKEILVEVQA